MKYFPFFSQMEMKGTSFLLMTSYLLKKVWINIFIVLFFIPNLYKCCIIYDAAKKVTLIV